jgi:hypothetical protein
MGYRLAAYVNHMGLAAGIDMREIALFALAHATQARHPADNSPA